LVSKTPLNQPPGQDEVEVSIFGPGVGESVVVHLGLGEWLVVDSCIDRRTGEIAALQYLTKLGVNIASAVKLVVLTHWHNDHMIGASKLFKVAESASFVCSGALQTREFAQLVASSTHERLGEVELPEFAEIIRVLKARRIGGRSASISPMWAIEGRTLYSRPSSISCGFAQVDALSPSDSAKALTHLEFARFLPQYLDSKLTPIALSPNNVAVVIWVRFDNARILLGGDLEESKDPRLGWQAIINSKVRDTTPAHVFKIPHHGSANGHSHQTWTTLLVPKPVASLTPYLRGKKKLPAPEDIDRIKNYTPNLLATAPPGGFNSPRRDRAVERLVSGKIRAMEGRMGHVRLRWSSTASVPAPTVELFSIATRL
jgi:hypothetical protein